MICGNIAFTQTAFLFVKKGGHKKQIYMEGERIHLELTDGENKKGIITLLRNDTIFLNNEAIPVKSVAVLKLDNIKKNRFPADLKTMLLISGGVILTGTGLSINNQEKTGAAFAAAAAIGYGPLLLKHFGGRAFYLLRRKKYRMGKKFRLQVLDFYLPARKGF